MTDVAHTFEYTQSFLSDGYRAGCSCGWESRSEAQSVDLALDDWDNHCEDIFIAATERIQEGR